MVIKEFSIGSALKFGWKVMRENIGFFVCFLIVSLLLTIVPYGLFEYFQNRDEKGISIVFLILYYLLALLVTLGWIKVSLNFTSDQKGRFSDLFSQYPKIGKLFVAHVIYTLVVIIGLLLFVVPGVIWALKYYYYGYFIVDKNAGPLEALELSNQATMGAKWDLLGFIALACIINLLGALCLGIGLFATIPTALVAQAWIYRKLSAEEII